MKLDETTKRLSIKYIVEEIKSRDEALRNLMI